MYPEMPKTSIINGVMQAIEIIIPKRKSNGEKEQVQTTITAVITNTIKPLKVAPTITVKTASAKITYIKT
jgi:hypothetical protein